MVCRDSGYYPYLPRLMQDQSSPGFSLVLRVSWFLTPAQIDKICGGFYPEDRFRHFPGRNDHPQRSKNPSVHDRWYPSVPKTFPIGIPAASFFLMLVLAWLLCRGDKFKVINQRSSGRVPIHLGLRRSVVGPTVTTVAGQSGQCSRIRSRSCSLTLSRSLSSSSTETYFCR